MSDRAHTREEAARSRWFAAGADLDDVRARAVTAAQEGRDVACRARLRREMIRCTNEYIAALEHYARARIAILAGESA